MLGMCFKIDFSLSLQECVRNVLRMCGMWISVKPQKRVFHFYLRQKWPNCRKNIQQKMDKESFFTNFFFRFISMILQWKVIRVEFNWFVIKSVLSKCVLSKLGVEISDFNFTKYNCTEVSWVLIRTILLAVTSCCGFCNFFSASIQPIHPFNSCFFTT